MSGHDLRRFKVNRALEYLDVDGEEKRIEPGEHRIEPAWASGVPTGESELECWIVRERSGAGQDISHDVDAETVAGWQASGAAEIV